MCCAVPLRLALLAGFMALLFLVRPAHAVQVEVEGYTSPVQIGFDVELGTAAGVESIDSLDVTGPRLGMAGLYDSVETLILDAEGRVDPHDPIPFDSSGHLGRFSFSIDPGDGAPFETRVLDLSYELPFELAFEAGQALRPLDVLDDTLEGTFPSRAFFVRPFGRLELYADGSPLGSASNVLAFGSLAFGLKADPEAGFAYVRGEPELKQYFRYEITAETVAIWLGGTLVESDFDTLRFTTQIEILPEPSHSLLLGSALLGLGALGRIRAAGQVAGRQSSR